MKVKMPHVVVGVGEVLWDNLPAGRQIGGAPANFAYHAHSLGAEARVASCVGDDGAGREIIALLEKLGLECESVAIDSCHPTGAVDVELDSQGKPRYVIHENVAWDFIPFSPGLLDLAARADAVCFGTLAARSPVSRETIGDFVRAARPECLRVFDVNLRQSFFDAELIRDFIALSSILKISDEELPIVAGFLGIVGNDRDVLAALLGGHGLKLVALTRGPRGSVLASPEGFIEHPGMNVQVADTVGAGDSFTAAVVMGLLGGLDLDAISGLANRLAAHVCSRHGAMPDMPDDFAAGLSRLERD